MKVDTNGDGILDGYGTRRGVVRGDFGFSFRTRKPVLEEINLRLSNTIYLMAVTLLVSLLIAIPSGILSAIKQYSTFDIAITTFSFAGQAIPEFWLGLILILVFYVWLKNPFTGQPLLPAGGMYSLGAEFSIQDRIIHLILPVTAGALGWIAWYSRFLRSNMLDVIHQDYMRMARAKGLPQRLVIYKNGLRNVRPGFPLRDNRCRIHRNDIFLAWNGKVVLPICHATRLSCFDGDSDHQWSINYPIEPGCRYFVRIPGSAHSLRLIVPYSLTEKFPCKS
jgi:ABC-type antimicrobial peptide transport system permease subunit